MKESDHRAGSATSGCDTAVAVPDLERDRRWAELAAAGDRRAFEKVYRYNLNRVYGLSLRLAGDPVEAEQLTQDTFVKAWFAIAGYSGRGPLGGWLARVATNLWRDRYRARKRRERLADEAVAGRGGAAGHEPSAALAGTTRPANEGVVPLLTAVDLERCIARLPERGRLVYVLHDIEGHTHREVAELLDVAIGTVKSQLHRAHALLRDMLTDEREPADDR